MFIYIYWLYFVIGFFEGDIELEPGEEPYVSVFQIISKLPNSEQSYKGKVKTHKYINKQNHFKIRSLIDPIDAHKNPKKLHKGSHSDQSAFTIELVLTNLVILYFKVHVCVHDYFGISES